MPNFPFWRRHGDQADESQLDELLAGSADAAPNPEWQSVSDVLRSAAAASEPSELADEAAMLAAFRREHVGVRHRRPQPIARCRTVFSTLTTGRIAACLAAAAVTITGAGAAAYACVLPTPIQSFAHHTIAAPAPGHDSIGANHHDKWTPSPSPTASVSATTTSTTTATATPSVTPKPTPSAVAVLQKFVAYRMCQDYTAATKAGKALNAKELAALEKLAGSASAITTYCAALPAPPKPACPSPTATATATATASPNAKDGKAWFGGWWWNWCGTCPAATATPTATPSPSASATADTKSKDRAKFPFFFCGPFDPGHFAHHPSATKDAAPHSWPTAKPTTKPTAKPTSTVSPRPWPKPTTFPSPLPGWFGGGHGFGFGGSEHNAATTAQHGHVSK